MPDVMVQRCLVHIQRMCLIWITARPKSLAGIELRHLVLKICQIKNENDKLYWINKLNEWYNT